MKVPITSIFKSRHIFNGRRRGYIVILLTIAVLTLGFAAVTSFFSMTFREFRSVAEEGSHTRALYLAQSGLETAIMILRQVPPEQLYQFGLLPEAPPLPLGDGVVYITISEENGKLNPNYLVNSFNDEQNQKTRDQFDRLAESLGLSPAIWDGVVDWVDENNIAMPAGYEKVDYALLKPPRRIKNGAMHAVEELLLVPGFDPTILYEDLRSPEQKNQKSFSFASREEKLAVGNSDYILANNLTVSMPETAGQKPLINLNAAPYHVILALSEYMTPETARAIVVRRLKNGGYFQNLQQVAAIPQLAAEVKPGISLFHWIESDITVTDRLYKILVAASLGPHIAHVMGIYDVQAKKLVFYLE